MRPQRAHARFTASRAIGVGLLLVLIAAAALPGSAAVPVVTVKVALLPLQSWGPLFIADKEGLFARQGIRVEWVPFAGAAEAMVPLAQGQIDVGAGAASAGFFNAASRGERLRIVADKGNVGPGDNSAASLILRKDLAGGAVKSVADLRGRKIALNVTGGIAQYMVAKALARAGLKLEDVELVRMPFPSMFAALQSRAIDAANLSEPWITLAREQGVGVLFVGSSEVIPGEHIAFIFYGPNLLDRDRNLGQRFMVAYVQALQQYQRGPTDRNVAIVSEYTKIDQTAVRKGGWLPMYADGRVDVVTLRRFQDWLYEIGLIGVRNPIPTVVDASFLDHANAIVSVR